MRSSVAIALACALVSGCAEDKVIGPEGDTDGATSQPDTGISVDAGPTIDGNPSSSDCDMTGRWIVAQVTFSTALGAQQKAVNWFYHDITQTGDTFTINQSLDCGFRVTGSTTVTINDATLSALAKRSTSAGRKGTFKLSTDGQKCELALARTYCLRGANFPMFLSDHWTIGDPDKALSTFPALPGNATAGMEDWDSDGKEGFTLSTGLGDRYVAQRDWNSHAGAVAKGATMFTGTDIVVTWDGQEAVSQQTGALLRTTSTPMNPGRASWAKVDGELTVVTTGATPELDTCKNVQRLALMKFPNP